MAMAVDSRACTAYAGPRRAGGPTGSVAGQARQADRKTNEKCNRLGKSSTNKRERVLDLSMLPLPIIEVQKSLRVSSCVGEGMGEGEREGGGRCGGGIDEREREREREMRTWCSRSFISAVVSWSLSSFALHFDER